MSRTDLLRGDFAAMFGRSVDEVFASTVRWPIPGSTSEVFAVHRNALRAFDTAGRALLDEMDAGEHYRINGRTTYSTAARTIAGNWRISRHSFGIAVDVNADANPYRGDNKLVTNLPPWWIESFEDSGFCWGGMWIGSKDSMHFAWQGPAFSGYDVLPIPYAPLTDPVPFVLPDARIRVVPEPVAGTFATHLADIDGNGAVDVVRFADTDAGLVLDTSVASRRHSACSVRTAVVEDFGGTVSDAVASGLADWDGLGGQDVWRVDSVDSNLELTVRWAFGDYSAETSAVTAVPTPSSSAWLSTADYDADGDVDLYVIDEGMLTVWSVDPDTGNTTRLLSVDSPLPEGGTYFLGDHDADTLPDLWALGRGVVSVSAGIHDYASVDAIHHPLGLPGTIVDATGADYDGDGRADLIVFDGSSKLVWLGNSRLPDGLPLEVWFEIPDTECPFEGNFVRGDLSFTSNGWIGTGSYEWRLANGLSVGCNPDDDDCAPPLVTTQSLAEFFAWVDGLEPVPGNTTLAAARAVTAAGYDLPCAPTNDLCLTRPLLRTAVASYFGQFLSRRAGSDEHPHRWVTPFPPFGPSSP